MRKRSNLLFRSLALFLTFVVSSGIMSSCSCGETGEESKSASEEYYDPNQGIKYEGKIEPLVEDGESKYKLVIPKSAHESEIYAAEEMQKFVEQSTGVKLPIVKDDSGVSLGDAVLALGNTKFATETKLDTTNLNVEGFRIKSSGDTIIIKGENYIGTLYGVYHFLEVFLDVKFLTQDVVYVPKHTFEPLYGLDITEIPEFQMRSVMGTGVTGKGGYTEGLARMRLLNSGTSMYGDATKHLGNACFGDYWLTTNMHSYNTYAPRDFYGSEHPDWFVPIEGNSGWDGQIHLSNGLNDDGTIDENQEGSLIKHVIAEIERQILEKPTAIYVPLGQNDNGDYCKGDTCNGKCVHQRELFGGHSGHAIVWANAIAREVTKWAQEMGITHKLIFVIYAYMYTQEPPKKTAPSYNLAIPDENVAVNLCPYNGTNYNSPIKSLENNSYFYNIFESWKEITKSFYIFDYIIDYCNYLTWYPNLGVLKPNVEYYKEMGAWAVVSCGENGGYRDRLETYILSKLFWHPNRDIMLLIKEFNEYMYGKEAGAKITEWVMFNNAHFERAAIKSDGVNRNNLPCYGYSSDYHLDQKTLNVDYIRTSYRYLEQAREFIEKDTSITQKQREQRLKDLLLVEIQIDYMKHVNYNSLFVTTESEKLEFYRDFYNKLTTVGSTKFANSVTLKDVFLPMGIF